MIANHPLMERFPHDGYCDWQFYPMLVPGGGATAVQFDALPEAFDPILEVVNTYKQISRQAALFEWRVGADGCWSVRSCSPRPIRRLLPSPPDSWITRPVIDSGRASR